ncbi:MAG: hypothetical protein KC593_09595 [Myxococcales bacterium]|nr:hypothetical protein [Myxococcales bacterium]
MSSADTILIETSCWPLVVMDAPPRLTSAGITTLIRSVNELYARRERFATLVDTARVEHMPTAAERRMLSEWQTETVDLIRRYNVCTATVVSNPLVRGAMIAMNWIFRPPNEQVTVATFGEALAFCGRQLKADGLALPSVLEAELLKPSARNVAELLARRSA